MTAEKDIARRIAVKVVEGMDIDRDAWDTEINVLSDIIRADLAPLLRAVDAVLANDKGYSDCVAEFEPDEARCCGELLQHLWESIAALRRARGGA